VPALLLHTFLLVRGHRRRRDRPSRSGPAAIMSIAAANLYTRNIHREFINKKPDRPGPVNRTGEAGVADLSMPVRS